MVCDRGLDKTSLRKEIGSICTTYEEKRDRLAAAVSPWHAHARRAPISAASKRRQRRRSDS